jgi:hypothetical protein
MSTVMYVICGREKTLRGILNAQHSETALLKAFRHFLTGHIQFDSDRGQGHSAVSRRLTVDRIVPTWVAFKGVSIEAAVGFAPRMPCYPVAGWHGGRR